MAEEAIERFLEVLKKYGSPTPKLSKLNVVVRGKSMSRQNPIFTTVRVAA